MATAAQLAWRKKFAAMAKAGTLPKKKGATKRRKNPSGRSGKDVPGEFSGEDALQNPKRRAASKKRRKNPSGRSGENQASALFGEDNFQANPKRRRKNPAAHRKPVGYKVHRVNAHGEAGALLATFATKPLAVEYARAFSEAHKVSVGIVGKAH